MARSLGLALLPAAPGGGAAACASLERSARRADGDPSQAGAASSAQELAPEGLSNTEASL